MRRALPLAVTLLGTMGSWACDTGSAGAALERGEGTDGRATPTTGRTGAALSGTEMPAAGAAADFVLTDTEGRSYRFLDETRGSVAVLFFGFTNCPDVCPVHMANLAAVLEQLPTAVSSKVTVVFVTVDPERDTPKRLREWLDQFDRDFVGLTGEADDVRDIQRALGMPAAVVRKDDEGKPDVGHAAQVMVFSMDRERRWAYPFGTRQADWIKDIPLLVGM